MRLRKASNRHAAGIENFHLDRSAGSNVGIHKEMAGIAAELNVSCGEGAFCLAGVVRNEAIAAHLREAHTSVSAVPERRRKEAIGIAPAAARRVVDVKLVAHNPQ